MKHGLSSPTTDFLASVAQARAARPGQTARTGRAATEPFTLAADRPASTPPRTPADQARRADDRASPQSSRAAAREIPRRDDPPRSELARRTDPPRRDEPTRRSERTNEARQPDGADEARETEEVRATDESGSAETVAEDGDSGEGETGQDRDTAEVVQAESEETPVTVETGLLTLLPDVLAAPVQAPPPAEGAATAEADGAAEGVAGIDPNAAPAGAGKSPAAAEPSATVARAGAKPGPEAPPLPAEAADIAGATGNASSSASAPSAFTLGAPAPGMAGTSLTAAAPQAAAPGGAPHPVVEQVPLGAVPIEIGLKSLQGVNRFEIRLDPPELGRVDVRIEIGEGGEVKAHLSVDRVETLALLQRDARTLERAFEQAGLKPSDSGIDLSLRDNSGQGAQRDDRERENNGRPGGPRGGLAESNMPPPIEAQARTLWRGRAGIDLRI